MRDNITASANDHIPWLERRGEAFPFFCDQPVALSGGQWLCLLIAVAVGFGCLTAPLPVLTSGWGLTARALLFPGIPLLALRLVAGPYWTSLFRRLHLRDLGLMLGFAVLNLIVSGVVGLLVMQVFGANANAAFDVLADQDTQGKALFFLRTLPQLFGEELLTIVPFLAVLHFAHSRFGLSRTHSVLLAWLLCSVLFGLLHLPSYHWNLLQCLLVIGTARLVLSLAYLRTKNIWVSTGAHVINDWVIFAVVLAGASQGILT